MIVYTFSEEQILNELIEDHKVLKKSIKNKVKKFIVQRQKTGKPLTDDDGFSLNITSPRRNSWYASISFTPKEKALWMCDMCCIAESDKGTKDYFILRGLNDKPYYIKVTSHAVKRFIERGGNFESLKNDFGAETFVNCLISPHETIVGLKYTKAQYYVVMAKLGLEEESDEETSYIFELMRGVYFGHKTDNGNFVFKTFISNMMSLNSIIQTQKISTGEQESFLSYLLIYPHQYLNRHLWDKENLNKFLYNKFGEDVEFDMENSKILTLKP